MNNNNRPTTNSVNGVALIAFAVLLLLRLICTTSAYRFNPRNWVENTEKTTVVTNR